MIANVSASGTNIVFESVGDVVLASVNGENIGIIHPASFDLFAQNVIDVSNEALDGLVETELEGLSGQPDIPVR